MGKFKINPLSSVGLDRDTDNHSEQSNLNQDDHTQYHNNVRADVWLGTKTTDDLPEGVSNKYDTGYAEERRGLTWFQSTYGSDLVTYLSTSIMNSMFQENPIDTPITASNLDGDPVGLIYDQSINATLAYSSTGRRPMELVL
mgnify:FL=1